MKPVIGIIGSRKSHLKEIDNLSISYTPDAFIEAIQKAGGLPLIIPTSDPSFVEPYLSQIDGLLLAGGQDVSPVYYGEEPDIRIEELFPERDAFEIAVLKKALERKMAIFAVCRGMQLINVALGGSLYQDLSYYKNLSVQHVQKTPLCYPTHHVAIEPSSHLATILGEKTIVNSFHHQAVKDLSKHLKAVAYSHDQLVEAYESVDPEQSILAVQWHPELLAPTLPNHQAIFNDFIERTLQQLRQKA